MLRCIKIIPGAADQRDIKLIPINIWVTPNNWRGLKALRFKPSDEQIILLKKFIPVGDFPGYETWKLLAAQNRYMSQQLSFPGCVAKNRSRLAAQQCALCTEGIPVDEIGHRPGALPGRDNAILMEPT